MQNIGIALTTEIEFDKTLWSLPPPSNTRVLTSMRGNMLEISYYFEYLPQSWREWQRINSIKIQMKELLPHIKFREFFKIDNVEKVYTVNELGKYYPKFIKYQKPLYPSDKDEFMRCLTLYAQRLHYEDKLYLEGVIAMAMHFNSKCRLGYSFREVVKKAKSVYMLDKDSWKTRLSDEELKKAHSKGGLLRVEKKRAEFASKRDKAIILRKDGMLLKDIASKLGVSLVTVKRWKLPRANN